jgi:dihydroorotate dehydrogenase (fumarate)
MDLSTTYLGFKLANPLIPGASPMCGDLSVVKRLEDAGAPMLIMHSVFQEQFDLESVAVSRGIEANETAEATSWLPSPDEFRLGPEEYLKQIGKIKKAVKIPVVASLNGRTLGGWVNYASQIQQAGADALELNIYDPVLDVDQTSSQVENDTLEIVRSVKKAIKLPLAVKLSKSYTALPNFAKRLVAAGADALVMFNRFYQPDIDIENLDVRRELKFSTSDELLPRLRWVAAMSGRIDAGFSITGGVHTPEDVIKATMVGAHTCQIVSALLVNGPEHLKRLTKGVGQWLEEHEYKSLSQARGSMSLEKTPNPAAFERGNYVKILQAWEPA